MNASGDRADGFTFIPPTDSKAREVIDVVLYDEVILSPEAKRWAASEKERDGRLGYQSFTSADRSELKAISAEASVQIKSIESALRSLAIAQSVARIVVLSCVIASLVLIVGKFLSFVFH